MNFQILKQGFLTYLQEKMAQENSSSTDSVQNLSDVSIFAYKDEFEDYLKEEVGIDIADFSGDMGDILSLEFKDGQFQAQEGSANELQAGLVNQALNDKNVKAIADTDKSGSLSEEEATSFLESLSDENSGKLEAEDIFSAANSKVKQKKDELQAKENENAAAKKQEGYSMDFLGDEAKNLSGENKQLLGKMLDTDGDGKLSEAEQKSVSSLLGVLDGNANALTKDDYTILSDFIKELNGMKMSDEEIINTIKGLDGKASELSVKDFEEMANGIKDGSLLESLQEAAQEGIEPNSVMEANGAGSEGAGSSGGSGSGSGQAIANGEKLPENMSIEELEAALAESDNKIKESEDKYMKELEKADKELHDKIQQANEKIKTAEANIENANNQITQYRTRVGEIDGQISELQGQLDAANKANEADEGAEGVEAAEEIDTAAIQAQIDELQKEKEDIENNKIPELEQQITGYESEITAAQTEIAGYETQVAALGENHPDLKASYDAYNEAVKEKETIKQTLDRRKADQAKEEASDRPDKSEGSKDYRDKEGIDTTNLPMTYTLNGQEYHCVGFEGYDMDGDGTIDFKPNSWEEVQRYFKNGGVENLGKYGTMQCHNYSDLLGQFVLGDANMDFVKALYDETNNPNAQNEDRAGYMGTKREWNPRQFAQCKAPDRDAERAIIENELQNGRPVLVSIPTSSGAHWGVAVGISDSGDIMIWDSYNGAMKRLGRSSNTDQNKEHRNLATGNGVMVFCEDYSYQYGTYAYIDYWEYIEQGPEYIRQNGYKK